MSEETVRERMKLAQEDIKEGIQLGKEDVREEKVLTEEVLVFQVKALCDAMGKCKP